MYSQYILLKVHKNIKKNFYYSVLFLYFAIYIVEKNRKTLFNY